MWILIWQIKEEDMVKFWWLIATIHQNPFRYQFLTSLFQITNQNFIVFIMQFIATWPKQSITQQQQDKIKTNFLRFLHNIIPSFLPTKWKFSVQSVINLFYLMLTHFVYVLVVDQGTQYRVYYWAAVSNKIILLSLGKQY